MNTESTLFLVCGRPASGKSTFAKNLAKRIAATFLDIDTATEPVIRAAMRRLNGNPDDRDSPLYKETFRDAIHECLFAITEENLQWNHVVVAAPFTKEQRNPSWLSQVSETLQLVRPPFAVYLRCDSSTLMTRLTQRDNPRDADKLSNWESYEAYYAASEAPAFPHLLVDTTQPDATSHAIESIASQLLAE